MKSTAVYVRLDEGICTANSFKGLCEKLTARGLNTPGRSFTVRRFYTEDYVATIRCRLDGSWMRLAEADDMDL